jgi:CheY-like chemotaxis protein
MAKKRTILAIDDNPMNLDILVNLLMMNYEILVALSAECALELLKKQKVNLIILDVMMPYMDGIEMTKIVKADERTKDIPILLLSANHDRDVLNQGFDAGATDYIFKPFSPNELIASIKHHLD